jgi:uncharacterized protein YrrD
MPEFNVNIGSRLHCKDGRCGQLVKVVVDDEQQITDLIVERGFLQKEDRVLPVSLVEETTEEEVHLSIESDELSSFPKYEEKMFRTPIEGWEKWALYNKPEVVEWATAYGPIAREPVVPMTQQRVQEGIGPDEAVIARGTPVRNVEQDLGTVDHVLVDRESGDIEHLVVDRGLLADSVIVPTTAINSMREEAVFVDLTEEDLEKLPRYHPQKEEAA